MRTRSEEPGDDHREWEGFLVAHIDTPASSGPGGINLHVGSPDTPEPGTGTTAPVTVGAGAPVAGASRQDLRCTGYGEELTSCEVLRDEQGRRIGRLSRLDLGKVVLLTATLRMTDGGTVSIDASNSTDDKWGLGLVDDGRRAAAHPRAAPGDRRRPGVDELPPLIHRQHPGAGRLRRPAPGVLRPRRCPARRTPRRPGC